MLDSTLIDTAQECLKMFYAIHSIQKKTCLLDMRVLCKMKQGTNICTYGSKFNIQMQVWPGMDSSVVDHLFLATIKHMLLYEIQIMKHWEMYGLNIILIGGKIIWQ